MSGTAETKTSKPVSERLNTVDGDAGDFCLAAPVEGHPAGTLVHVTVSALRGSQLRLDFSDRDQVLTDACVLLCGHTGALKLLELGYTGPLARRPQLAARSGATASRRADAGTNASEIVGTVQTVKSRAHRVVVVGGGFGGLQAVLKLRRAPVEVTLVDRRNFHLFQPLTYQVATGALSPGEIAYPLRAIFKRHRNIRVLLAEVADFDLDARELHLSSVSGVPAPERLSYDTLIVAGGSNYSYFGHEDWRMHAAEVKSLESALAVRSRLLAAFEAAEAEPNAEARDAWLTFVVVGAGPTGVEIAGQIAELARDTLRRDFRAIDPRRARILLVEAADRVLTSFPPSLSGKAERSLQRLGVTVLTSRTVIGIDAAGVTLEGGDGGVERIRSRAVVWAAGVTASRLAGKLAELTGAERDRAGRVTVESDLTLPGHLEVFAIGDMIRVRNVNGDPVVLPGVAPVAMQQGRYAAAVIRARIRERQYGAFRYRDKGNLATIGRAAAVADIKGLRLSGFPAWATWLLVHLWYLIGFQNRLLVLIRWSFSFATHGRGARLITEARAATSATVEQPRFRAPGSREPIHHAADLRPGSASRPRQV